MNKEIVTDSYQVPTRQETQLTSNPLIEAVKPKTNGKVETTKETVVADRKLSPWHQKLVDIQAGETAQYGNFYFEAF